MRPRLMAAIASVLACQPLAAQEGGGERGHVAVVKEMLALFQSLTATLGGVQTLDDLRGAVDEIDSAGEGMEKLQAEAQALGRPSPDVEKRLQAEFAAMESLQKTFELEWDRVLAIEGARDVLRGTSFFRIMEGANRAGCKNNLRQIGMASFLYEQEHGRFPEPGNPAFLKALADGKYLEGNKVFVCKSSGVEVREGEFVTSYATWASGPIEEARKGAESSKLPIAWDGAADHHGDVRCVLFADAHIEEFAEKDFEELLAGWEEKGFKR